jgi:hypothetical protein
MPLIVTVTSPDLVRVSRLLKDIADKKAPQKAISEAINRSLRAGRTAASVGVRARYTVSADTVKSNIEEKRANWSNLTGSLAYKGPMLPIELFPHTVRARRTVRRGPRRMFVHATIIKGNRKQITGAFTKGDGRVMERRQPERFPIFRVMTIGLPYMVRQTGIVDSIQSRMSEVYNSRLEHNIQAFLTGVR